VTKSGTPSLRQLFAANLKRERIALGLSQKALAHMAGVHRTFIGSVERGESNITMITSRNWRGRSGSMRPSCSKCLKRDEPLPCPGALAPPAPRTALDPEMAHMTSGIRIIRHEGVKDSGSFEVRFPDDRPPRYFYWDDVPSRRLRPDILTSEQALEQARAFARAERDKGA
jgi:DNA-binding XRE family transcriptional regulator